ncbi:YfiR family protein [Aquabacterium sp. A7-Y]|uniref:YfiR family protein n=1 Tax=Aquabacterium sp. A7-Y TaxID=1349605 RepID=UPI00223D64F8|nr:YfiR family protein [Aquabacterium sp. A7-Y]MCW7537391.1 YfiR family protein [Aquabacterium sp. A7-Y]
MSADSWNAGRVARGPRRRFALAALMLGLALPARARAAETALAASVKAVYLYKFLDYVEWPPMAFAGADSPIVIGVAGSEEVFGELRDILVGRTAQGRPLQARRVVEGEALDGLHLLYLGRQIGPAQEAWLARWRERPILFVSDAPQGAGALGVINFTLVRGRVRFEVSLPAAERAGLKLSSRMLSVAERVIGAR